MDVRGKVTLFVKEIKVGEEVKRVFSGSLSTKKEDGTYCHRSMDINFDKNAYPVEKLNQLELNKAYQLEIKEGWIGVREFSQKGETKTTFYIYVKNGELLSSKEIAPKASKDSDLPF